MGVASGEPVGFVFALVMLVFFIATAWAWGDDPAATTRGIPLWLWLPRGLGASLWLAVHAWRKSRGTQ